MTVGLAGSNGSGKSTLLNLLAGLWRPRTGKITINGSLARSPDAACGRLLIPAGGLPRGWGHPREYLRAILVAGGHLAVRSKIDEALEWAGITHLAMGRPRSSGENRRLFLALARAAAPRLLLLDEPFAFLDETMAERARVWLHEREAAMLTTVLTLDAFASTRVHVGCRLTLD